MPSPSSSARATRRHAFLIIAHHEPEVLHMLLLLLDDPRNDIYLHIDRRSAELRRRFAAFRPSKAGFRLLQEPIAVYWGDISQVKAEFKLFETAHRHGPYAYYHLLSGVDLPIKPQDDLHRFFDAHAGQEFVEYHWNDYNIFDNDRKTRYYYLFTRHFKDKGTWQHDLCTFARNVVLGLQKMVRFRRRPHLDFLKGHNWVSITEAFCSYLLEREKPILHRYRMTKCPDEIFLHTLLWNSPFRDRIYRTPDGRTYNLRAIDWVRGAPYTWQEADFDELMQSPAFFARKIESGGNRLRHRIYKNLTGNDAPPPLPEPTTEE